MSSVTIVYEVVDEKAWEGGGNPLHYQHHGLKAHTAAAYDAVERCHRYEEELQRLRNVVGGEDSERIDLVLADET